MSKPRKFQNAIDLFEPTKSDIKVAGKTHDSGRKSIENILGLFADQSPIAAEKKEHSSRDTDVI